MNCCYFPFIVQNISFFFMKLGRNQRSLAKKTSGQETCSFDRLGLSGLEFTCPTDSVRIKETGLDWETRLENRIYIFCGWVIISGISTLNSTFWSWKSRLEKNLCRYVVVAARYLSLTGRLRLERIESTYFKAGSSFEAFLPWAQLSEAENLRAQLLVCRCETRQGKGSKGI